jgi:hypothetical protein
MATERWRQQLLLGVLVVALLATIYRMWPTTSATPARSSNRTAGAPARPQALAAAPAAPGVHLDELESEWPKPGPPERNLFRFKPKPAPPPPPPPPRVTPPTVPVAPVAPGPPPPPAVPPITLRFIGIMESPAISQKIAVLSDGRGSPIMGKEGEIVDGRYRILKIGVESVEIAYADGRGRQTIRLSAQ